MSEANKALVVQVDGILVEMIALAMSPVMSGTKRARAQARERGVDMDEVLATISDLRGKLSQVAQEYDINWKNNAPSETDSGDESDFPDIQALQSLSRAATIEKLFEMQAQVCKILIDAAIKDNRTAGQGQGPADEAGAQGGE